LKLKSRVIIIISISILISMIIIRYSIKIKNDIENLKNRYSYELDKINVLNETLDNAQKELENLKVKIEQNKLDKKRVYFMNLKNRILGRYAAWGMKMNDKDEANVELAIRLSFSCAEILKQKGELRFYGKTIRECALRSLAQQPVESNFNPDLVHQNYAKDRNGYICNDGTRYKEIKNNENKIVNWYGVNGIEYAKDERGYIGNNGTRVKSIKGNEHRLIKTTKDWGWQQVNDCNLKWCFDKLYKLGLWNPKMNRWALDPEINIYMRYLIDDKRIQDKMDISGKGHWDQTFLNMLERVEGWEEIYN